MAENLCLLEKNQKYIKNQAKWINMELMLIDKEKIDKKKQDAEEQKQKKERLKWQEKIDKLETELIRFEREKGISYDKQNGFLKIIQNPDEAFNILAKKLDNANRSIIKHQVNIYAAEKDVNDLKHENMALKMELNKANLLFKGRKLQNFVENQLRKRRDKLNKSVHDMPTLDKTAISWTFDPQNVLQNRNGIYRIKSEQNELQDLNNSGSIFVDKTPKSQSGHSRKNSNISGKRQYDTTKLKLNLEGFPGVDNNPMDEFVDDVNRPNTDVTVENLKFIEARSIDKHGQTDCKSNIYIKSIKSQLKNNEFQIKAIELSNKKCKNLAEKLKHLEKKLKDEYYTKQHIDYYIRLNNNKKRFHNYKKVNKSFSYIDTNNMDNTVNFTKTLINNFNEKRDNMIKRDIWNKDYNLEESKGYILGVRDKLEDQIQKKIEFALGFNVDYETQCTREKLNKLNVNMAFSCHDFT